jgi:hypothetical protein
MSDHLFALISGATYRPLTRHPRRPCLLRRLELRLIAAFLAVRGWMRRPGRSGYRHARLSLEGPLVVLYANCTALVQDKAPERTYAALAELVEGGQR